MRAPFLSAMPKNRSTMDTMKHAPQEGMVEFEKEWHHLRIARTMLEWLVIAAIILGVGYGLWPYLIH